MVTSLWPRFFGPPCGRSTCRLGRRRWAECCRRCRPGWGRRRPTRSQAARGLAWNRSHTRDSDPSDTNTTCYSLGLKGLAQSSGIPIIRITFFGIIRTYFNVWNLIIRESYCGKTGASERFRKWGPGGTNLYELSLPLLPSSLALPASYPSPIIPLANTATAL